MITGETVREIAVRHGRKERTVEWWIQVYDWPAPLGRRGRAFVYDPGEADAAVREILAVPHADADPDELLTAKQAAADAGLAYGSVRAYISKGDWPEPDAEGPRRWRRSKVRDYVAARKPDSRRRARIRGSAES